MVQIVVAFGMLMILAVIAYFFWAVHYDDRRNLQDVPKRAEVGALPTFFQNRTCVWCIWESSYNFASNEGETSLRYMLTPTQREAVTDFKVDADRPRYLHATVSMVSDNCGPGARTLYAIYVLPGQNGKPADQVTDANYAPIGKPRDLLIEITLSGQLQPGCSVVAAFGEPYLHSLPSWLPVGRSDREFSGRDMLIGLGMLIVFIAVTVIIEK